MDNTHSCRAETQGPGVSGPTSGDTRLDGQHTLPTHPHGRPLRLLTKEERRKGLRSTHVTHRDVDLRHSDTGP